WTFPVAERTVRSSQSASSDSVASWTATSVATDRGRARVYGEVAQPPLEQDDLAIDEPDELAQARLGRRRLEQLLALGLIDLDDPGQEVGQDRRVVRDGHPPGDVVELVPVVERGRVVDRRVV